MQSNIFNLPELLEPILNYLAKDKALYPVLDIIFTYPVNLSDETINGIIRSCPYIKYLDFGKISRGGSSDTAIINIANSYPNLIRLNLWECGYISDTAIKTIARSCHNLQHLDLGLFSLMSESTVCAIVRSCKNLRYLCLLDCSSNKKQFVIVKNIRKDNIVGVFDYSELYVYLEMHHPNLI
ncbi:hypothetical protein Glove_495g12 [Diversispora epigaea]|uniref:F-box domain-containing protein n=1 Tax=Diversispora epigaea TaxID=1348612 RepID=A0A397GNG0_9GLOM|nr:hypothetical protein Glove_495g12 [Diversispora epigaea]